MHITKLSIIFRLSISLKDKVFSSWCQVTGARKYRPSSWKSSLQLGRWKSKFAHCSVSAFFQCLSKLYFGHSAHNRAVDYFWFVDFTEGQGLFELVPSPWDSEISSKLLEIKPKWVEINVCAAWSLLLSSVWVSLTGAIFRPACS